MTTNPRIPAPVCKDLRRRADLLVHPVLNGIDFVEYEHRPADPQPYVLVVRLLKPVPNPQSGPDNAYGLSTQPHLVAIHGGSRIVGLRVLAVNRVDDRLELAVDRAGDFSIYALSLGWVLGPDGAWTHAIPALDPLLSVAYINFKAGCPVDFDCRQRPVCPPEILREPLIDYLAKDYASFRQLLLDTISQINPDWTERNPADLGIALVELLAYEGDRLSYFQDAAANESYLDTARQRISARRHARLVDYRMHDGRNAWAFIHLRADSTGPVPMHARVLTRVKGALRGQTAAPGVVVNHSALPETAFDSDPALARAQVFETAFPIDLHPENNLIFIHAWGDLECCLGRGTIEAHLFSTDPANPPQTVRPALRTGDYLLLEETMGPLTGAEADAHPGHRQVVQIESVEDASDPAYQDHLLNGELQVFKAGDAKLPLLRVQWRRADGLRFPLCLSATPPGRSAMRNVSVARGNIVLADHGRTIIAERHLQSEPVPPDEPFRLQLKSGPITMQCQPEKVTYDGATAELATARTDLSGPVREARPAVAVLAHFPAGIELWESVPDLLDSPPFEQHFVAEVDNEGRAHLRFGDGEYGRETAGATGFEVTYRIGNGRAGNVGAEALAHIVQPAVAPGWPVIALVRNPLPAQDGTDAETIEQVRQTAPAAFRAEQFRAVTEEDYAAAARKIPEVAGAVASFRWTGSWHTVFIGIDPRDAGDLITELGGRTRLSAGLERRVRNFLTRYKLAGYDLEIRSGEYVPLEIDLHVCVKLDHFRGDVAEAVRQALSNRVQADGTRGFFHSDNFTFGNAVYLSRLYAAVEAVEGVDSLIIKRFQRFGKTAGRELETGVLPIGPWEIARLDNDPNFMENGVLRIDADGGK